MDLNLYLVFVAIMQQGSVSKAADVLGLTQPATSNALSRLRLQMGDPLFVRTRDGMLPTHRAKAALPQIEQAVAALKSFQAGTSQDLPPLGSLQRHFKLVMSDLEETLFLPDLIAALAKEAPGVTLEIRQFQSSGLLRDLESGLIDLVLAHSPTPPNNTRSKPLLSQGFACVSRQNHPHLKGKLDFNDYTSLKHILVAPDRGGTRGVIDSQLQKMGRKRTVVCSVPHFLSGCLLAARCDHLLTLPRRLAERVAIELALDLYDLPFPMPGFTIGIHWHWTRDSDPEHESFRNFLMTLLGDPHHPRHNTPHP